MTLFRILFLGLLFITNTGLLLGQNNSNELGIYSENIDSIYVNVETFNLYLIPPTEKGIRIITGDEYSIFVLYPTDSVFNRPVRRNNYKNFDFLSNRLGIFDDFLLLYDEAYMSVSIDENSSYFIGRILVDYYKDGQIIHSIFLNEGSAFTLNGGEKVFYTTNVKLIFNKLFSYIDYVDLLNKAN